MLGVSSASVCWGWRRHHAHTAHSAGDSTGAVGESLASGARPVHANTLGTASVPADAGAAGALATAGFACGATKAGCGASVLTAAGGGGAARWTDASLTGASMTTGRVRGGAPVGDGAALSEADGVSATPLGRAVVVNADRFGFLGVGAGAVDNQSVPDLLTGVDCLGVVVGSGVAVAVAAAGSGPAASAAEESPLPSVDVWAPPELLTTTFGPESLTVAEDSDEDPDEDSDADESSVEPSEPSEPAAADPPVLSGVESVAGLDADVSNADEDVDADDESADELDEADKPEELGSDGSAHAIPGVVATAIPIPSATAKPPTRPIYFAVPMVVLPQSLCADGSLKCEAVQLCAVRRRQGRDDTVARWGWHRLSK
jgi:hypothetical protein